MTVIHANVNCKCGSDFENETDIADERISIIIFKSPAEIIAENRTFNVKPGTAVVWKAGSHMHYRAAGGEFVHDFAHFSYSNESVGKYFDTIPEITPISLFYGEEISHTLEIIVGEAFQHRKYVDKIISHLNHVFWNRIKREVELQNSVLEKGVHYQTMYALRDMIYSHPEYDWNVYNMCEKVHLSQSYFQHKYREYFGVSSINDVINARISVAKKMLTYSDMKIGAIAEQCGYKNVEHFTRQFKSSTGISPGTYRGKR